MWIFSTYQQVINFFYTVLGYIYTFAIDKFILFFILKSNPCVRVVELTTITYFLKKLINTKSIGNYHP